MRSVLLKVATLSVSFALSSAAAATWYVDDSVATSGDGKSWAGAFKKIQEGIDAAANGDTVIVAEGTYVENIRLNGKNIVLTSTNPLDPTVVANTIIDGNKLGSVVTFSGTENKTCVLSGFTICNGDAADGGGICGGAWRNECLATICNNVVTANSADDGGAVAFCNGLIENNVVAGNEAWGSLSAGGGLYACDGAIQNNVIEGNSAVWGGGLSLCDGTIANNIISGNNVAGVFREQQWFPGKGGGLSSCNGTIQNNTITGNSAAECGAALADCRGAIRNCIIWGNRGPQIFESNTPTFSCIEDWTAGGSGNTNDDPLFAAGCRLLPASPCIDAGVNYYWFTWPQRDLDGNCRLAGRRVEIGCYEYGSLPDSDGDLLCDFDEEVNGTDHLEHDSDGDGLRDGLEVLRGSSPLHATGARIVRVPADIPTIQEAICLAVEGEEIIVAPGVYPENIRLCGPNITLRGSCPTDCRSVALTLLDGRGSGPVVMFAGHESASCVLSGLTITGGRGDHGGGISGGLYAHFSTRATIENNIIACNEAYYGGGLGCCDGIIRSNTITCNSAGSGGGAARCNGRILNNTICHNSAHSAGGIYDCAGSIVNCIVWGNTAPYYPQTYGARAVSQSCVENWTQGGEGNIGLDPMFMDANGSDDNAATYYDNDYRLLLDSPCIDTGKNEEWMWRALDLDGNPRIWQGKSSLTVDMGAYEYGSFQFKTVKVERNTGDKARLTWNSRPGRTYIVWYSLDVGAGGWTEAETIPSQGTATVWTAPSPIGTTSFYRVQLKPDNGQGLDP